MTRPGANSVESNRPLVGRGIIFLLGVHQNAERFLGFVKVKPLMDMPNHVDPRDDQPAPKETPAEADQHLDDLHPQLPHVPIKHHPPGNIQPAIRRHLPPRKQARHDGGRHATNTMSSKGIPIVDPPPLMRQLGELDPQRLATNNRAEDTKEERSMSMNPAEGVIITNPAIAPMNVASSDHLPDSRKVITDQVRAPEAAQRLVTQRAMTDWKFSARAVPASKASHEPQMMIMLTSWKKEFPGRWRRMWVGVRRGDFLERKRG
ncbi:LOW QUALITY PROTEIN: hypothetical protein QC763_0095220 [Podospora pseudopauciseta]|uniref:Uncharacterized protein n=1 Tax=Podospora pseudopauciseta TaxID=2093780 RepID=A0ABR0H5I3_9PEZI|nr:LOW QUALITY PROTEIN: hypothetical protein QC763_0095220 [Podospora pseudopauciseta]